MKRTGFKRKPHSPFSSLTRTATLKRQKAIVIDQNRVGTPKQAKFDVWDRAYEEWEPVRARKMGEANCQ